MTKIYPKIVYLKKPLGTQHHSVWVDNIFSLGNSIFGALEIIKIFELEKFRSWGLAIKESSRELLLSRGCQDDADDGGFARVPVLKCLRHFVGDDGGVRADWEATKPKMWSVVFKNSANSKI